MGAGQRAHDELRACARDEAARLQVRRGERGEGLEASMGWPHAVPLRTERGAWEARMTLCTTACSSAKSASVRYTRSMSGLTGPPPQSARAQSGVRHRQPGFSTSNTDEGMDLDGLHLSQHSVPLGGGLACGHTARHSVWHGVVWVGRCGDAGWGLLNRRAQCWRGQEGGAQAREAGARRDAHQVRPRRSDR